MIFITGDTHCPIDIAKLNTTNFPEQRALTRDDYVIILGDFGLYWHPNKTYEHWYKWLQEKPWTTLWIDGNHENFDWLDTMPVTLWHGGKVQQDGNIIHLMRGQVFDIAGLSFFTFGGAESVDKALRSEHTSWWSQETPSYGEVAEGLASLAAVGNKVDYVLTHTCPYDVARMLFDVSLGSHATEQILQNFALELEFREWYFGHWHANKSAGRFHCLYNKIVQLV